MTLLGIECATESCSVALFDRGALVSGTARVLGRGHAEALIPMIAELPGKGRAQRIAVSLGPGSFTGLRVGLAAARALALAWQGELVGYSTHALIAAMACAQTGAREAGVAMTGGHGEWFVSRFDDRGQAMLQPRSLIPARAAEVLEIDLVAGSQAEALVELRGRGRALKLLPDARQLSLLGDAAFSPAIQLDYGRPPDARLPVSKG
ncbi:MAG: tRNA (adenosine(37)-N6)-threonylcarbamoyltransferase complex dimerization subunit type 1 TsaB [Novosphingobium sp.]